MLQFVGGIFVTDNDGMRMLLQAADGPHVVNRLFDSVTEGAGLVVAIHHNHHLLGVHHCTNTYSKCSLGDQIDIIIEDYFLTYFIHFTIPYQAFLIVYMNEVIGPKSSSVR